MSEATPRPWEAVKCPKPKAVTDDRDWPWLIKYTDGDEKFDLAIVQTDYAEANARLIVRAVNSFEPMREALKAAFEDLSMVLEDPEFKSRAKITAALALAEKETP